MSKRTAEQASLDENGKSAKKQRGPYFKWLKGGKIPPSTKGSRKKVMQGPKKSTTQQKTVSRKKTGSNLSKVRTKKPLLPSMDFNRQLELSDDNKNLYSVDDHENNDINPEVHEGPNPDLEDLFEHPAGDAGYSDSLDNPTSPLQQETSLIASDFKELIDDPLNEVHDPAYEFVSEDVYQVNLNDELTEVIEFDENYDLDESLGQQDSCNDLNKGEEIYMSPSLHDKSEEHVVPSLHDESDDNDSDEEEMVAEAPGLYLSEKKKVDLLLLLATKKRHNLTYSAAEDIMELAGVVSSEDSDFLPKRYLMKQAIEMYSAMTMTEHHVCPVCGTYVGIVDSSSFQCDQCKGDFSTDSNKKNGNLFLYLSLADQIEAILKHCHNDIVDPKKRNKIGQYNLEDIYDGKVYKKSVESGFLTMNCFVDGLQVSSTSKSSAWPVLGCINELPLHLRRKYILMASLWLSLRKPNCQEYLKPFVVECNVLSRDGLKISIGNGKILHYRIKILMCISDTIARPLLRNSTQFNGEFGCGLCYHPGVNMKYKKGTVRSYSLKNGEYALRTHEEIMNCAGIADNRGTPVRGIKGKSVFSDIVGFNVAYGLDLDFFHVLVNVAKRFAYLWFSDRLKTKPYSLFNKFDEVDSRFLKITPTSDIARAPRSLKDRSDFRGHEWFHWVVEYSIPVLKNILAARYLNHWGQLVHSVAILMQNSVSKSDVCYSARHLNSFVQDIDRLYGPQHVTISVHLLTHLGESVFNFAQPWTHSAFMFESFNHDIKNFVKSSNGIAKQISKGMQLRVALKNLEEDVKDNMTSSQTNYYRKMTESGFRSQVEPHLVIGNMSFLGKPKLLLLSPSYLRPLKEEGLSCENLLIYDRCIYEGELYYSSTYKRVTKQNNSVVLLDNQRVFCIDYFVVACGKCFILGKVLPKHSKKLCEIKLPHILVLREPENLIRCHPVSLINCKLLSFKVNISTDECLTIACINVLQQEMLR